MKRISPAYLCPILGIILSSLCCPSLQAREESSKTSPFTTTEINFKSHDGFEMFGKLVLPASETPRAIVTYVQTAEGATVDMKRPLSRTKTFNYFDVYRTILTSNRIGLFSYEGRGIRMGEDLPRFEQIDWDVYNTSSLDNKVSDLLTAIKTFQNQPGLQNTPITGVKTLEEKTKAASKTKMEFHYFNDLDHSLNIGEYFSTGELPAGHQAIFSFINRIAPP